MTREEKIKEACDRIGGVSLWNGRQVFYADEVSAYYYVSDDDLVELSDLMHCADDAAPDDWEQQQMAADAYSRWCASYGEEVPAEEQEKIRDYCDA